MNGGQTVSQKLTYATKSEFRTKRKSPSNSRCSGIKTQLHRLAKIRYPAANSTLIAFRILNSYFPACCVVEESSFFQAGVVTNEQDSEFQSISAQVIEIRLNEYKVARTLNVSVSLVRLWRRNQPGFNRVKLSGLVHRRRRVAAAYLKALPVAVATFRGVNNEHL